MIGSPTRLILTATATVIHYFPCPSDEFELLEKAAHIDYGAFDGPRREFAIGDYIRLTDGKNEIIRKIARVDGDVLGF